MPLIINSFYFCDADGKTDPVQSREKKLADDTTPEIGTVCFERVRASRVQSLRSLCNGTSGKANEASDPAGQQV